MDLHWLMGRFREIPYARDGGPEVPGEGPPIWATEADEYVTSRQYLRRYPDYLEFLRFYGGAGIYGSSPFLPPDGTFFEIYGFGDFYDPGGELSELGLFAFAFEQFAWRKPVDQREDSDNYMLAQPFSFDGTGRRPAGVYVPGRVGEDVPETPRWPTFTAWLAEMVNVKGRWMEQTRYSRRMHPFSRGTCAEGTGRKRPG